MDTAGYASTSLWRRTLAARENDPDKVPRDRLRAAYEGLRRNAIQLVAQISVDLPQITLHDVRHLDGLWKTADLIAGDNFELTPTEAFVFGAAVLLHDAGHALATISGGLPALKETTAWRDTVAAVMETRGQPNPSPALVLNPPPDALDEVLFRVLREIHGRVAETLGQLEIENKTTGARWHILEDSAIRTHYGALVGQIAATHNWDVEDLLSRFQNRVGAIADLPANWTIDPIKIACLLRCSDAAQVDQERAPDFLFALLKLRKLSVDHWLAQNKLAQPIIDPDDGRALLYSPTSSYSEAQTDAWWIATRSYCYHKQRT
jgi:hypothetical protein